LFTTKTQVISEREMEREREGERSGGRGGERESPKAHL
jgi:hypothetical protein